MRWSNSGKKLVVVLDKDNTNEQPDHKATIAIASCIMCLVLIERFFTLMWVFDNKQIGWILQVFFS